MSFAAKFTKLHDQNNGDLFVQGLNVVLIQPTKAGTVDLTQLRLVDGSTLKVIEKAGDVAAKLNKCAIGFAGRFLELADGNASPFWIQGAAIAQMTPSKTADGELTILRLTEGSTLKVKDTLKTIAEKFTEIAV